MLGADGYDHSCRQRTARLRSYRLPQAYTGKGVVVGVQDIGFDLTHPNFFSKDMSRYRIKAMWDQLSHDTIASTLVVGRDYVGEDALLGVGCPLDGLTQTHGTHTAGIAAGSGAEGNGVVSPYQGMAPDADIVMVANATSNNAALIDSADYYKYTYARMHLASNISSTMPTATVSPASSTSARADMKTCMGMIHSTMKCLTHC